MVTPATVRYQTVQVKSPRLDSPVEVIAAFDTPYVSVPNRLQNLTIYLRKTPETMNLVHGSVTKLEPTASETIQTVVHVHGGAWRAPDLTSTSIEAFVAHAFSEAGPINVVASINYTLSSFPSHGTKPYDSSKTPGVDPAREAKHPDHVTDVLHAFELLRYFGLTNDRYILTSHSCGACLAFQSTLQPTSHWDLASMPPPPRPAALIGMNGLFDLPALVHGLAEKHEHLKGVYKDLLDIAFGDDEDKWVAASPALFDPQQVSQGVKDRQCPRLVVVDQSAEDQLVPVNQADRMQNMLEKVEGIKVLRSHRATGPHAEPWEGGLIIWQNVGDVLKLLS